MDYNRVQSYIKSHVLPKLDSLPDDVASVKQAFDTWRKDWTQARAAKLDNLDATISSRASSQQVDGVRGGVDTTLQRLTDLEGSVNPLDLQPNVIVRKIKYNANGVILNVSGKGKLLCVAGADVSADVDLEVNMDDKKKLNIHLYAGTSLYGCYVCQSNIISVRNEHNIELITSFGRILARGQRSEFIADEDAFSYMSKTSTFFTSYKPIGFNTNLTITAKNKGGSEEKICLVAYALD